MAHALQSANNISQKAGLTLVRPFFVGVEAFRRKMRCALDVNFIYNGEGHGKIVIKEASRTVFDRAARKDSATT